MNKSILQHWVMDLGLRHQGVLLTAIRGCDVSERDEPSKLLARFYRACILVPHVGDIKKSVSFMKWMDAEEFQLLTSHVLSSHDHLPHHYIMHVIHSAEILGYYYPIEPVRTLWHTFYLRFVSKLHLCHETKEELDERLNADEETFGQNQ